MTKEIIFPMIMICGSFLASALYGYEHKWGSSGYWFFAALLNIAVTFVMPKLG